VHHDAQYFDRPYEFLPERWLDPKGTDVKEASQPFSVGPRGCIGRKYVYLMMPRVLRILLLVWSCWLTITFTFD